MSNPLATACEQFEALFLRQLLEAAGVGRMGQATISVDDDAPEATAQRSIFSSLVSMALADSLVASGGSGLGRELQRLLGDVARK